MSIQMSKVSSSNINSVGYDPSTNTLAIQFGSGTYHYKGVTQDEYDALRNAKSVGSHFAANIRPKYEGKKI